MRPSFVERLADPEVRNVLICGCGGGFDFVHGLTLYPWEHLPEPVPWPFAALFDADDAS
jgi:hypothetical protein